MKQLKFYIFCLGISFMFFISSCKKKGCIDPLSYSYDSDADKDDGSCGYYYGGRDYGQLDVGSEIDLNNEYDIYIDNTYIGRSLYYFPNGLSCGNPNSVGKIFSSGTYKVKAIGNGGTEIREGSVTLKPQQCKVVLIENLAVQSSGNGGGGLGGNGGYNCSSGSCVFVSSNGQYSTLADCQSACGGGGGGSTGTITFWVNQDLGCGNIFVSITSYGSGTINSYYSGNPSCGASGCANFNNLSYGAYYFSATSDGNCTWSGNVQLDSSCETMQLTL
jgi:hypothetical protein